jgi:tripartite-type tricarboxylate transporter receptor subunit TctC
VSKTALPAKNITELLDWIRAERGKVTYGHAGVGSASHLCMLMLMKELGVQLEGVAYRGTGPAMNDLMGGQFDFMCDQTTGTTNPIKGGKIKGYAVTTKFKVSSVPDLPTLDRGAIPGFEVAAWHAMWAPKGLSKDVSDKLVAALQAAIKDQRVIERFADLGTEPVASSRNSRCAEIASCCRGEAMCNSSHQARGAGQLEPHGRFRRPPSPACPQSSRYYAAHKLMSALCQ